MLSRPRRLYRSVCRRRTSPKQRQTVLIRCKQVLTTLLLDDLRLNKLKIQNSVRIVTPEEYIFSQTTRCARIVMYPG